MKPERAAQKLPALRSGGLDATVGVLASQALVESSLDAIVVFDNKQKVLLVNQAAEELLGFPRQKLIGRVAAKRIIPKGLYPVLGGREKRVLLHETKVTTADSKSVPVRVAAVALEVDGKFGGAALIAQDLRDLKRLEREKVDAERMAAVGQTVAGLAHGIKNILTGLEGGMYVTSSGLKRGDQDRVRQGWEMLERNMGRISDLARIRASYRNAGRISRAINSRCWLGRKIISTPRAS